MSEIEREREGRKDMKQERERDASYLVLFIVIFVNFVIDKPF